METCSVWALSLRDRSATEIACSKRSDIAGSDAGEGATRKEDDIFAEPKAGGAGDVLLSEMRSVARRTLLVVLQPQAVMTRTNKD